ncbi:hypothetical protein B0H17DRAFT_1216481 [Mycena rosella]|uniref:CCHC-type domain-containing protein n=1 Tax=Mycena rosella TaxID=1033263 RepID=A0AAD7FSE3_MYCRO|nr:hypothetical protein B0H17DRAFT_1216481 [Mycena rosella]
MSSMLALLRLRAPRLAFRAAPSLSLSLRALSTAAPTTRGGGPRYRICLNCRREGHEKKDCTQPTICVACGVEGHERKHCPNPDPARIEALKTAPIKCFRCGEEGHGLSACPQPPKCFACGQPVRLSSLSPFLSFVCVPRSDPHVQSYPPFPSSPVAASPPRCAPCPPSPSFRFLFVLPRAPSLLCLFSPSALRARFLPPSLPRLRALPCVLLPCPPSPQRRLPSRPSFPHIPVISLPLPSHKPNASPPQGHILRDCPTKSAAAPAAAPAAA